MKFKLVIFFLLVIHFSVAQKQTEKQWNAQQIEKVDINGEGIFKIYIKNSESNTIDLVVKFEGEHSENLVIIDSINQGVLKLSTGFQPLFKADNDKLSAHKVLSVELQLSIPKHIDLNIKSDIAQTKIEGQFPNVFIELKTGNCTLDPFFGNATINTISGNINIKTNNAKTIAKSKTGIVDVKQFKLALYQLNLQTVNGNINVSKI
ncbi:hypothetical protein [Mesoflavibacter sp. CH_XMU1404-2]|uniref:hypothetical protein n=1 Tax=Mesoflavibacter sp. CH_XMU1404-2 TaxID=3107766 RepID=UPI00300ABAB2